MIVDTRRQAPSREACEPLFAVFYPRLGSGIPIGTADHSLKRARDLLFLTDSSRFIHRPATGGLSVIDPLTAAVRFTRHIGKINDDPQNVALSILGRSVTILALWRRARIIPHPVRKARFIASILRVFYPQTEGKSAGNKESELTPECTIITIRPL